MKRLIVVLFLPLMLFGLERVNLIKDAGFEKDSDVWDSYVGRGPTHGLTPAATVSTHDSEKAYSGSFSASCDTRTEPLDLKGIDSDSAIIIQGFITVKHVEDFDSLSLYYSVFPRDGDYSKAYYADIGIYVDADQPIYWVADYGLESPDLNLSSPYPYKVIDRTNLPNDNEWHFFGRKVRDNLEQLGFSTSTVDSLILDGWSTNYPPWRGQKIYFDDIRLTGYADYDVGVKSILSGDSTGSGYTPTARIKNFGRKAADTFLVIAEIKGGSGTVYADTLPYALPADTEDTLSFKAFTPPDASNYTLTVRTEMTPDESDEDDEMSKTLYGSGIEEQPISSGLTFEISSFTTFPRVSYSIPAGQQGTISLYDPTGRRIESLRVQGGGKVNLKPGLAAGVYFVKLTTNDKTLTRKAVLVK